MKIKAFLLAVVLIFSVLPLDCGAYAKIDSNHTENVKDFLQMLNLTDETINDGEHISRAQFISLVVSALNYEASAVNDGYFTDIPENHPYAGAIYKAKSLGVISGKNSTKFFPDSPISYEEAVKVIVCALGYMRVAEVKGGYPVGYLLIANEIDLLKRVPKSDEHIVYEDALIMIFNMMHANKCEIFGVAGEDVLYKPSEGGTILSDNWGLYSYKGIVRVAGFSSAEPSVSPKEPTISIDGVMFKTSIEDAENYLGFYVTGYYDEENNLKAIYKDDKNTVYTLEADEILNYNNFKISYAKEGSINNSEIMLDRGFSFVKNGKALNCNDEDFIFENGFFKLIDYDYDGLVDFVIANEYTYMVVSGISNQNDSVYDLKAGKTILLKRDEGYYFKLCNADGEELTPASLEEGTVLTLFESADSKYIIATVSKMSVRGTITEINDNTVTIDDTEYKVNSYFKSEYDLSVGIKGDFLLASDGTVTALLEKNSEMRYGYLISYYEDTNGLSGSRQVLLLDQSGKYCEYVIADKVSVDGRMHRAFDKEVSDVLSNQGFPRYQLFKYKLDDKQNISVIDTAAAFSNDISAVDKYTENNGGDNSLKLFVDNKNAYFYRTYNVFSPYATVGGHTLIFKVPKALADSQNIGSDSDARLAYYDKKYFTIESTSTLRRYDTYLLSIYDQNSSMQPSAVLLYDGSTAATETLLRDTATAYVVEKVTDALNDDGEKVKKMTVWGDGKFSSLMMSKELVSSLGAEGLPRSGDIITMSTNAYGEIQAISVDLRCSNGALEIKAGSSGPNDYNYHTGEIFSTGESTILLRMKQGPTYTASTGVPVDGIVSFSVGIGSNTYFLQYDMKSGQIKQIKQNDLKTVLAYGDNASNVAVYNYYHGAMLVVEYVK